MSVKTEVNFVTHSPIIHRSLFHFCKLKITEQKIWYGPSDGISFLYFIVTFIFLHQKYSALHFWCCRFDKPTESKLCHNFLYFNGKKFRGQKLSEDRKIITYLTAFKPVTAIFLWFLRKKIKIAKIGRNSL